MMKMFYRTALLLLALLPVAVFGLEKEQIFFPLQIPKSAGEFAGAWALSLDTGYIDIETKPGIVNLLEPGHPMPKPGELYLIREPERIQKILKLSGTGQSDVFSVLSSSGKQARAQISGFAYFRPASGSLLTLALVKPAGDSSLSGESWQLALKNYTEDKKQKLNVIKIEDASGDACPALLEKCKSPWPGEKILETSCKQIDAGDKLVYVASFWRKPVGEFDIEDLQTSSCAMEKAAQAGMISVPQGVFPEFAFSLSAKGDFYLLGRGGSGAEVCQNLLEYKSGQFAMIKSGLCLGY
jgi:hypothetical protein